jgi:hypothetical protein
LFFLQREFIQRFMLWIKPPAKESEQE